MRIARRSCEATMNLYRQNNGRKRLFLATFLVILLYVIDIFSGGGVRGLVRGAGALAWKLGTFAERFVSGSGYFSSRRLLESENAALREHAARSEERAAAYQVLSDENNELRAMLRVASLGRGVTAPVTSSFRASPYGTFTIGAGSEDAIAPGDIVLSSENFVIGRVEEASAHNALVRTLFAPGVSTDALVGKSGISAEGQGGGNARASMMRDASVAVGDPVISNVFGGRAIGVVGAVEEDTARASKIIYIRLPVNLSALQFVYIVKK